MAKSGKGSKKDAPPAPERPAPSASKATTEARETEKKRFWAEVVTAAREGTANHATEELQSHRKKAQINFSYNLRLVLVGILIFALLNRLETLAAAVGFLWDLLTPLLLGGMLALILNVPMRAFERLLDFLRRKLKIKKENPAARSVVSLALTFLSVALLLYLIVSAIVPQTAASVKSIFSAVQGKIPELLEWLKAEGFDTKPVEEFVKTTDLSSLLEKVTENVVNLLDTVVSGASSVINGTVTAAVALIFAVYILANRLKLCVQSKKMLYAYVKKPTADRICRVASLCQMCFSNFISGQCLEAIILGVMFFVVMTIFRFPYAIVIGTLIAVTAIIPYIGAFLGCVIGMLLISIEDPIRALLFLGMFLILQQIEGNFIYPKVVGGSVGLPAIWTFCAVIIGGALFGVAGMLLFIPLTAVVYTLLRESVYQRLSENGVTVTSEAVVVESKKEADDESL